MAADESKTGNPPSGRSARRTSWRGSDPTTSLPADKHRWRNPRENVNRDVARQNLRRRIKLGVLTSIVIGLSAVFGWVWLMRPRATPLLAITITRYGAPLPPNSFAREDAVRLANAAQRATGGRGVLTVATSPGASNAYTQSPGGDTQGDVWNLKDGKHLVAIIKEWLERATSGGPDRGLFGSGGAVVVYISGHGVVDEKGRACLVPADSVRLPGESDLPLHLNSERWLPVADLVAALDETRPDVNKLLVLDCNRIDALWSMGILCNSFAAALTEALGQAKSVAILNSAGAGEAAWSSVELQGTPFGFFATRALIGHPACDGDRNGNICVSELGAYVAQSVSNWVRDHRRDQQRPLLVRSPESDFDVVFADPGSVPKQDGVAKSVVQPADSDELTKKLAAMDALWSQLDALWQEEQEMQTMAAEEVSPVWSEHCLAWHGFLQDLVRCEALILAGEAYRDPCDSLLRDLKEDAKALRVRRCDSLPAQSLALAERWGKIHEQKLPRAEVAAYLDGERKTVSDDVANDYYLRADAAWQWLTAGGRLIGGSARDAQRKAVGFIKSPPAQKSDVVEIHLLKQLAADAPDSIWNQTERRLLPVANLRETAEQAAAPHEARVLYALRQRLESADAGLRRLENALFVGPEAWSPVEPLLEEEQAAYEAALGDARQLSTALARRDRAWAELPYLAAWLTRREELAESGAPGISLVSQEIQRLRDLDAQLDEYLEGFLSTAQRSDPDETLQELARLAGSIDRSRLEWREKIRLAVQPGEAGDEVTLRGITALLANPLVTGAERLALRKPYLKAVRNLAANVGESEAGKSEAAESKSGKSKSGKSESGKSEAGKSEAEVAGGKKAASPSEESTSDANAATSAHAEKDASAPPTGDHYLRQLCANHPALPLLRLDEGPPKKATDVAEDGKREPWKWLAEQGGRIRRRLLELTGPQAPKTAAPDDEPRPARAAYSAAERNARSAAALCAPIDTVRPDAIERLVVFDLNEFLAWRAGRTLIDFWGSGEVAGAAQSYFALAWTEWYDAAKGLRSADQELAQDLQAPWKGLKDKHAHFVQQTAAVSFGLPWPEISHAQGATFQRRVTPVALSSPLPPGEAALYLRDAEGAAHEVSADGKTFFERLPAPVGGDSPPAEKMLTVRRGKTDESQSASVVSPQWSLNWLYRGHRHTKPFTLVDDEGLHIVYQRPPEAERATVTVLGNELAQASIVFILDCSQSMKETTRPGGAIRRIQVAQNALTDILGRLPTTQECRVGLWLYGHRLGWTNDNPPQVNVNQNRAPPPGWGPGQPANKRIGPEDDVEQVASLKPFGAATKLDVETELGRAGPWGETPLYLSILRAVTDTDWPTLRAARHLVLITDGEDYQFRYANNPGRLKPEAEKAIQSDRRAHPQNPIKLHVLDCTAQLAQQKGVRGGPRASTGGNAELKKFVLGNQGNYYPVENWEDLKDTLIKALGLAEYEVRSLDRNVGQTFGPTPLGETSEVPGPFDPPREYRVSILGRRTQSRKVRLEGNEALQLSIFRPRSAEEQLVFERYTRGEEGIFEDDARHRRITLAPVAAAGEERPASFDVIAHRPQPEQRQPKAEPWTFPISIQDGAQQPGFSPRPAEAWVEIRPLTAEGQRVSIAYPFYDLLFEPQTSVPVLLCRVPAWPSAGRKAEVRVWLKFSYTAPSASPRIGTLSSADDPQAVDGLPGVTVGATAEDTEEGCRLAVTEQHAGNGECRWLRVATFVPADHIVRTFSEGGRWARHVFTFRGKKSQAWLLGQPLLLTVQDAVKSQAIAVDEPLRLDVPVHGL